MMWWQAIICVVILWSIFKLIKHVIEIVTINPDNFMPDVTEESIKQILKEIRKKKEV